MVLKSKKNSIVKMQSEHSMLKKRYEKVTKDKLKLVHLLIKVNKELEESLNNEKRFIASVSHELRTPLTAILGYGELLEDTPLNNKQKRYLDNILHSSNHLLALVSDLLDVAKIGDNRIDLVPKEVDLDDILNDCANLVRSRVHDGVELITDIPMPEYKVKVDDKRVKQIFINLLSNATKFTKQGSIRFYIQSLKDFGDKHLKLVAKVDDTGPGIPKVIADTLFEPFQSTDKTQGTGLGLYISQKLAQMMGGEITVQSREGIGSSFTVTLIIEKTTKKEIGKALNHSNIMMFSKKSYFVDNLTKEFINLGVNFQNHDIQNEDITSSLIHMIASGRFYDVGIFDFDSFGQNTDYIAGTFRAIKPDIKLIALISDKDTDTNFSKFDKVVNKPISYQRFIKEVEETYDSELFGNGYKVDYSNLDILIVEDVEINREYEKEMLDNFFGITCDTAENGEVAVNKAKEHNYDAILMDMRMPIMDGLEATRRIRSFNKDVPIICMSANVYKEDKLAAENSGMNDFIEKPLDKKDIEAKLIKLLNKEFNKKKPTQEERYKEIELEKREVVSGGDLNIKERALAHLQKNFPEPTAKKLLGKAKESIVEYVSRVRTNFKKKDIKELVENFHALKGVLSNLGLKDIADIAGELQTISENGDFLAIDPLNKKLLNSLSFFLDEEKEITS
jgi:CheY-like chemotaxis protein/nitrogen-specific signal transduction histidine kinase